MIDLAAEVVQALRASEVQSAFAEAVVGPIVAEILKALEAREKTIHFNSTQLAQYLGITRRALSMRLRRGSKLATIAKTLDGKRVWRRDEVDGLLGRQSGDGLTSAGSAR